MRVNCENTSTRRPSRELLARAARRTARSFADSRTSRAASHAHEPRIAAHLAQLHQRVEDRDRRRRRGPSARIALAHLGVRGDADALVELALRRRASSTGRTISVFGGSSCATLSLVRRRMKGATRVAQRCRAARSLPLALDRDAVDAVRNASRVAEQARASGSRTATTARRGGSRPACRDRHRRWRASSARTARVRLAARVLDRLRLVEDRAGETRCVGEARRRRARAAGSVVITTSALGELVAARCALAAVQHARRAAAARTAELALPVADQARRRDDQRGPSSRPASFSTHQVGDGLQRLAEAHVVGEHAAGVVRAQVLQPGHALALVGPQRRRAARPAAGDTAGAPRAQRERVGRSRIRVSPTQRSGRVAVVERRAQLGDRVGARIAEGRDACARVAMYSSSSTFASSRSRAGGTGSQRVVDAHRRAAAARDRARRREVARARRAARAAPAADRRGGRRPRRRARARTSRGARRGRAPPRCACAPGPGRPARRRRCRSRRCAAWPQNAASLSTTWYG